MVHNGIEYGLMQAYAEGFALMRKREEYNIDLAQVAQIWRYGSVVRSWLLDLTAEALEENPGPRRHRALRNRLRRRPLDGIRSHRPGPLRTGHDACPAATPAFPRRRRLHRKTALRHAQ